MESVPGAKSVIDTINRRQRVVEIWAHNIALLEDCGLDTETLEALKCDLFEMPLLTKEDAIEVVRLHEEFKKIQVEMPELEKFQ